jgi:hypothetical protein
MFLNVSIRKGPSSGNESKVIHVILAHTWRGAKETNGWKVGISLCCYCITNVMILIHSILEAVYVLNIPTYFVCGMKHVGILSVILWYKCLMNKFLFFVGWVLWIGDLSGNQRNPFQIVCIPDSIRKEHFLNNIITVTAWTILRWLCRKLLFLTLLMGLLRFVQEAVQLK